MVVTAVTVTKVSVSVTRGGVDSWEGRTNWDIYYIGVILAGIGSILGSQIPPIGLLLAPRGVPFEMSHVS